MRKRDNLKSGFHVESIIYSDYFGGDKMNWEKWYYIFNIFAPFITMIGIIISFWISLKSLKETRQEKVLAQRPYLLFWRGGVCENVFFVKYGEESTGFNQETIQLILNSMPEDSISVQRNYLERDFGTIQNYGNGTAFNISLTWIPKVVWLNDEKIIIDKDKMKELKYSKELNTRCIGEFNLLPRETTGIIHWPLFIELDYNLCITRVDGYFQINYDDSFGNNYNTYQGYHLFTYYKDDPPSVHVTFLESFNSEKEWEFEE